MHSISRSCLSSSLCSDFITGMVRSYSVQTICSVNTVFLFLCFLPEINTCNVVGDSFGSPQHYILVAVDCLFIFVFSLSVYRCSMLPTKIHNSLFIQNEYLYFIGLMLKNISHFLYAVCHKYTACKEPVIFFSIYIFFCVIIRHGSYFISSSWCNWLFTSFRSRQTSSRAGLYPF